MPSLRLVSPSPTASHSARFMLESHPLLTHTLSLWERNNGKKDGKEIGERNIGAFM